MIVNVCHDNGVARYLFVIVPVVARLWPAVAIGDALVSQGHEVAWCGPENVLRPLLGPDGLIYPTGRRSYREFREVGLDAVRELWDEYVMPLNRFISRPVSDALDDYQPDVVVADQYALTGALAAHRRGIRWATLCAGTMEILPPDDPRLRQWVRDRVARIWELGGVPADASVDLRFSPYLTIVTTAHALTDPAPMPAHCLLVGAALGPRRTDPGFDWDWLDPGRQHLLVTAGTLSDHLVQDFLARMMKALAPLAGRVQAVVNTSPEAVPDPPANVLVAPRVPMVDLMRRMDAVFCQGGQSTVNEALAHGLPLVIAPIRLGELTVAEQVARTGAGLTVSFEHSSPAELADAVTAVLDKPGYRASARRVAQEYAAAGGTSAAVTHLAALASGH